MKLLFTIGIVCGSMCLFTLKGTAITKDAPVSIPEASDVTAAPAGEEYRVNPFDVLEISVYQEPDLNKTVRVSQDGYVSFPLIGKVAVAGMDILSAEDKIADLLRKDYLVSPDVTILVKEYSTKKVFVMGEVKNPGSYSIPQEKNLTVLESIAMAGGFNGVAAMDGTRIIRVENGAKKNIEVKISDITKRGDKSKDIPLKPNDIVYIPQRLF
jgi:polysaccharide export outer membrane protein